MSENYRIEIRDTENVLLEVYSEDSLWEPSDLVDLLEHYRSMHITASNLQITQWMPDKKGYITIGEGY